MMKPHLVFTAVLILLLMGCPSGAGKGVGVGFPLVSQSSAADSLRANFTYSPVNPVVNQPVHFIDHSSGNISFWQWNFGDGAMANASVATEANKTHIFTISGNFSVWLLVVDALNNTSNTPPTVVSVRRINTSLSLDAPEATGNGSEVLLKATLVDEYGNRVGAVPVSFYVNDSRGNNVLVGSDFTDSIGRVSVSFVSNDAGSAVAVFNGTLVYAGAVSNMQLVSLGVNLVPYAVLLSVAVLIMSVAVAYLRRSRRQPREEEEPPETEEEEEED
jgi:PKD repeat protein